MRETAPADPRTSRSIAGVILAGGETRRLEGKPFRLLGGRSLIEHVIARARPQVGALSISVRGDTGPFIRFALPLILDGGVESLGPVAGIAAALRWAKASGATLLATFPCDAPFLPLDLVSRLERQRGGAGVAIAAAQQRTHPAFALWETSLGDLVNDALARGERRLGTVAELAGAVVVNFSDDAAFANVNSEDDLRAAEARVASDAG